MTTETVHQAADSALKVSLPVGVSASSFLGLGLDEWVYVVTIIYTVLQGAHLIYKWKRSHNKYKEDKNVKSEQDNRD